MAEDRDTIGLLYDVADDNEANVLDDLRLRAGLVWECPDPDCWWRNPADAAECGSCGREKPGTAGESASGVDVGVDEVAP